MTNKQITKSETPNLTKNLDRSNFLTSVRLNLAKVIMQLEHCDPCEYRELFIKREKLELLLTDIIDRVFENREDDIDDLYGRLKEIV